jgi:ABC-2 type transport system permease protein
VFRALFAAHYSDMVEYRLELLLWMLAGFLPIILMGVWIEAAQTQQFAFSKSEFIRYFFTVFLVRQTTAVWVIREIEEEVVSGKLSLRLLQPIEPVWHHVAAHVAEQAARLPFLLFILFIFFCIYPAAFWIPDCFHVILFVTSLLLAYSLRFLVQYTFALLAFWVERVSAIDRLWYIIYLFLSGVIAPLDVFPPLVKQIVLLTPFPYMVYFPVALTIDLDINMGRGLLTILVWAVIFGTWNRWLWWQGLKQYSAMGA